jgi:hypothetical protein
MSIAAVDEPISTPPAKSNSLNGDLILVRLLALPKKFGLADLRRSLDPLFQNPPQGEQWAEIVAQLRSAGVIDPKKLLLTELGREKALGFLEIDQLPPRMTWQSIKSKFLVPKALGQKSTPDTQKRLTTYDHLAAILLKKTMCLGAGRTLSEVLTNLVCQELKIPEMSDWKLVRAELLSKLIGADERLSDKRIKALLPRQMLGAAKGGVEGLRQVVFTRWTCGKTEARASNQDVHAMADHAAEVFDLPAFASTVLAAARVCPSGRLGNNKVFINHVWDSLLTEPSFPRLDLNEFKRKLVDAHCAGLLTLSRADMAPDLPAADVQQSETHYQNAEFHFVLIEEARP